MCDDIRRFLVTTLWKYIQTCTDYHRYILFYLYIYICIHIYTYIYIHIQIHTSNTPRILCFGEGFFRLTCIPGDGMWDAYSLDAATSSETTGELWLYFRSPLMKLWFSGIHQTFLKILLLEEFLANHLGGIKPVNRLGQGTYSQCGTWSIWTIFEAMNHAAVYIYSQFVHELGDVTWCWVNLLI